MLEQLSFYSTHSLNDLRVNGQRTLFALLCIAAGVAAIVSLQTLGGMIEHTLTGNLQDSNRGDIQIKIVSELSTTEEAIEWGQRTGVIEADSTAGVFGGITEYYIGERGLRTIQRWIDRHYPGQIEMTYRQALAGMVAIFTGSGSGTMIDVPATDSQATSVTPLMVDPGKYPLYGEIVTEDGTSLRALIQAPTDVVLSQNLADTLKVNVGDTVRVSGANASFTVRGVVPTETEIKDLGSDALLGIFGYYYLSHEARSYFPDLDARASILYFRLQDPARVEEINKRFAESFAFLDSSTTEDLRQSYTELTASLNKLITVMGLISLLIGGIGIMNTMQVIVRRRTLEVAVLKTLGFQGRQVTVLFLVEAFLMGLVGSLGGIVLGWAMTFVIKGVAETFLGRSLAFALTPGPAIGGFVVGVLVTTIFGFLPTLAAGQVRPGIVLRPTDTFVPKAGRLATLAALVVMMVVLSLVARTVVDDLWIAVAAIVGAFVGAGVLYALLWLLIYLIGRFLPSFGSVDLNLALRSMLAGRGRGAVTLLALVVGVFSLSVITLMSTTINRALEDSLGKNSGGNVIVQSIGSASTNDQVKAVLDSLVSVRRYSTIGNYQVDLVALEEVDGVMLTIDEVKTRMVDAGADDMTIDFLISTIDARDPTLALPERTFLAGRELIPDDVGQPVMVITDNRSVRAAGIEVGDKLTFEFKSSGMMASPGQSAVLTFEVVGIARQSLSGSGNFGGVSSDYAPLDSFPMAPSETRFVVDMPDELVPELRRQLGAVSGVFVLETKTLNTFITSILDQLTSFPLLVAALSLIVGGVVIANSVALSTTERRREIAIMKSVGLQRERVLGMLLMENALMGLIGGLIGVGIGLVALVMLLATMNASSAIPIGTALILMGLCVAVALVAAMTTAWGASGEKPLNVLRYE